MAARARDLTGGGILLRLAVTRLRRHPPRRAGVVALADVTAAIVTVAGRDGEAPEGRAQKGRDQGDGKQTREHVAPSYSTTPTRSKGSRAPNRWSWPRGRGARMRLVQP
jgi:hypothetical protein